MSDLIMSHGKKSNFDSFSPFGFTLVITLSNFDFESHLNTLIILIKKDVASDLMNMSQGRMYDFVSFPLFGFTLVIKLRNFDFGSH